jgi:hypothetical protein
VGTDLVLEIAAQFELRAGLLGCSGVH